MRVIMLIEVADENGFDNVLTDLQRQVEMGSVDGYFTLCKDGQSMSRNLPHLMRGEKNLSDFIAPMERIITGDRDPATGTEYGTLS